MDIQAIKDYIKSLDQAEAPDTFNTAYLELMQFGEAGECQEFGDYLADMIAQSGARLQASPQLFETYQSMLYFLKFKAFAILSSDEQHNLLEKRLYYAVQKGFEPDLIIAQYFDIYDLDKIKEMFVALAKDLEQNTENLGANSLEIEGKKYLPQIKYWLLDYSKFPSRSARRESIDRLNYLNKSPNIRALTQGQRQVLSKVLKLYDDFNNPTAPVTSRPAAVKSFVFPQPVTNVVPVAAPQPTFSSVPAAPVGGGQIDISQKLEELRKRVQ